MTCPKYYTKNLDKAVVDLILTKLGDWMTLSPLIFPSSHAARTGVVLAVVTRIRAEAVPVLGR